MAWHPTWVTTFEAIFNIQFAEWPRNNSQHWTLLHRWKKIGVLTTSSRCAVITTSHSRFLPTTLSRILWVNSSCNCWYFESSHAAALHHFPLWQCTSPLHMPLAPRLQSSPYETLGKHYVSPAREIWLCSKFKFSIAQFWWKVGKEHSHYMKTFLTHCPKGRKSFKYFAYTSVCHLTGNFSVSIDF